ncbi:hypothetical protein [Streptomyces spongiae]|uniref:Uncharacterized protein n=1 Tax=Streptomyces spongiae TaxID=565072 RepID=A0A5N8XVK7_9ACTN|nr:hypothetical protein [Streptomyces spongiae]MPY63409.1 hypothetical protein [Streptomyces spongiae]
MPQQTPVRPTHSEGGFAELFARKTRTPLRGFLPGRRVWSAVGGCAATVLVIVGTTAIVSRIDWNFGTDHVATAAEKKAETREKRPADGGTPSATASSDKHSRAKDSGGSGVVQDTGSGGSGSGGSAPGSGSSGSGSGSGSSHDSGTNEDTRSTTSSEQKPTSFLWSDGSVDSADDNGYWDQSTVTVKSTKSLSSLKVVVKIIQTGGVADTGTWTSLGDQVTVATGGTSGELDYVVTLNAGVTLDPGTYTFKFGYNHDQGNRDAGGDRYNVTATTTSSDDKYLTGGF